MNADEQTDQRESVVGVISDTHGVLRPQAIAALSGVDLILHAGDVGGEEILEALGKIAPVITVRGNTDRARWTERLPHHESIKVQQVLIHMVHDLAHLEGDPTASGIHVVVSGHSHKPLVQEHNGVLYLNPGSAGPVRFQLPISVAKLFVCGRTARGEIIPLAT